MEIYIHIGLPKTASTFFQNNVFSNFKGKEILYNPKNIMDYISELARRNHTEYELTNIKKSILGELKNIESSKILISEEGLSGIGYEINYLERLEVIKNVFPDAHIILFLRFQPDLILSLYKQSLHQGHCKGTIQQFLNYKGGEFVRSENLYSTKSMVLVDPYEYDYSGLIRDFTDSFSEENMHIFFYESFRNNKEVFIDEICSTLGVTNKTKTTEIVYKSLSSLSCWILINLNRFCELLGYKVPYMMEHKTKFQKLANIPISEGIKSKRTAELIPFLLSKTFARFRSYLTWVRWRDFYQLKFDKIIYFDKDLLSKYEIREKLNDHYKEINKRLLEFISIEDIPKNYINHDSVE